MNELTPPPEALTDPNAVEFARIWAAHKQQHVSLRVLVHHVANAYEREGVATRDEVLQAIVSTFLAEFAEPTDAPTGGMVE